MKLECVKQKLKDALLIAERFTGKQLSLPVLRYVLLLAGEKNLRLRATNLDLGIEIEVPARVEKEGIVAVSGDVLGNFLSNLPSEKNIVIEEVGNHITISGQTHSTLVKKFGYDDFPTLPSIAKGATLTIGAKTLSDSLRSVVYAAATTDIKPEFACVYCYTTEESLILAATDSSRLAERMIPLKHPPESFSVLLPAKNAQEIIRVIETVNEDITIIAAKNQISINSKEIHITSRLVDGVFPDYKQIIPKKFTTEATILKQDLSDRLKLTNVFSGKLQQVRIKIDPNEKFFEVESKSDGVGETMQQIDSVLKGEPVEYLLNQRYISEALPVLSADSVQLLGSGPGKPLVIKSVGDQRFTYLVMPMRG